MGWRQRRTHFNCRLLFDGLFSFRLTPLLPQVNVLEDQIDGQTRRTEEVEKSLRERQAECRRLEEVAAKERRDRAAQELRTGELKTEVDLIR